MSTGKLCASVLAYIRGDLESDSDMDGYQRIANVAQNELEKLDKEDSYWAGYFFAREEAFTESHYAPERIYHYDKADQTEAHRLKSIIELGCERLQIIQSSRR